MNASRLRHAKALGIAVTCTWMIAASAGEAAAADPAPAVAGSSSDADRLFEQGVAAQKAGKLADAEALFVKAWGLKRTWDIAANLGLVELKQGKLAEGAGHVAYAIANLPPTESDTTRESLAKAFAAARTEVAEVKVSCDVEGATVRVGGKVAGVTPLGAAVFAAPGSVTVEVTKDGYEAASRSVEATKGGTEEVALTLVKNVGAPGGPRKEIVIAGGALGGASVIAGAVLLGVAFAQRDALRGDAPKNAQGTVACSDAPPASGTTSTCEDIRSKGRTANALGQTGVGLLIGGGAVGAATVLYALWPRPAHHDQAAHVVPMIGPSGAGLLWTGSF